MCVCCQDRFADCVDMHGGLLCNGVLGVLLCISAMMLGGCNVMLNHPGGVMVLDGCYIIYIYIYNITLESVIQ